MREIPILGAIPAGQPIGESERRDGCLHVDLDTLGIPRNARTFALKVRGDSMTGAHILDGDIVILELKPPSHGRVVAALIDGESTLKTSPDSLRKTLSASGKPELSRPHPRTGTCDPGRDGGLAQAGVAKFAKRINPHGKIVAPSTGGGNSLKGDSPAFPFSGIADEVFEAILPADQHEMRDSARVARTDYDGVARSNSSR
jgi:hypothetical protein